MLTYGILPAFHDGVHILYRQPPSGLSLLEFIGSRNCVTTAFNAECPLAQGQQSSSQFHYINGCYLFMFHHGPISMRLTFPIPTIINISMLCICMYGHHI